MNFYQHFDDLIESSERLMEYIKESSETLQNIQKQINSNNQITVTHNDWTGDFGELIDRIHLKTSEDNSISFGQQLLNVLETGIINE